MNLTNARVLITGGSLGIGRATAALLGQAGAKVVITGRDTGRLQQAAQSTGAHPVVGDMGDEGAQEKWFNEAVAHLGGLDVLINNAGIGEFAKLGELSAESFRRVYATNVFGLALLTQRAAAIFKEQNAGHIVNIASTAALNGFAGGSVYASSKFALRGLTQCWQAELRPHNVRVCLINPSEVLTAFNNAERVERPAQPNKLRSEEIAHAIKSVLLLDDRGFIPELTVFATNPWATPA